MHATLSPIEKVFSACADAFMAGVALQRVAGEKGDRDGEGWLAERLDEIGLPYLRKGRQFPDFKLPEARLGIEVKTAAFPDRKDFDANSHLPSGTDENGDVYYLFLRYLVDEGKTGSPLVDLVLCHGDLLNLAGSYVHLNDSVPGFGSYGDIKMRLRNMYRPPSPYELLSGLGKSATLIAPASLPVATLVKSGGVVRTETDDLVKEVRVDYETMERTTVTRPNPTGGRQHRFNAWRPAAEGDTVRLRLPA